MPISPVTLQRRQAELGRIRLGRKAPTRGGKTRPDKLDTFRFTSVSEQYVNDLANLYGGTPQPWDNAGIASFEVLTTAKSIPVIVVRNGITQWMETWSGGGCVHRCDGVTGVDGEPCDTDEPDHVNAKPTTRLSVMLPELEAIGVWRLESHGWNAAAEIPAVAELAQYVGDLVPAVLHLVERRAVKNGQTSRFVVPVLDLKIGASKLREVVEQKAGLTKLEPAHGAPAIEAAKAEELPARASKPRQVKPPTVVDVDGCDDIETLRAMWKATNQDALKDRITERVKLLNAAEIVEAELVEPEPDSLPADKETVWLRVVTTAGNLGMSLWDTESAFREFSGVSVAESDATCYAAFLDDLKTREVVAS